jgi:N-methylhydantoinase A
LTSTSTPAPLATRPAGFEAGMISTKFFDRELIPSGSQLSGPAVVFEYSSTTVVPPDYTCRVDRTRNLILRRRA